jgi:hypothetical protein
MSTKICAAARTAALLGKKNLLASDMTATAIIELAHSAGLAMNPGTLRGDDHGSRSSLGSRQVFHLVG